MRPGEGLTGAAVAELAPVMIAEKAHLDPRFKHFATVHEEEYESILAVPILAREKLEGALNVRTRRAREYSRAEIELLEALAAQVAQSIEHAKLYAQAQRRVVELEALAEISEAVSESLYLEGSVDQIVETAMHALGATKASPRLEDGQTAWTRGVEGAHEVRMPLRWKRRVIGELVCERDTPFVEDDKALLASIAHHAAVAGEDGRGGMRGGGAQEIPHPVKNKLPTGAPLPRPRAAPADHHPPPGRGDPGQRGP